MSALAFADDMALSDEYGDEVLKEFQDDSTRMIEEVGIPPYGLFPVKFVTTLQELVSQSMTEEEYKKLHRPTMPWEYRLDCQLKTLDDLFDLMEGPMSKYKKWKYWHANFRCLLWITDKSFLIDHTADVESASKPYYEPYRFHRYKFCFDEDDYYRRRTLYLYSDSEEEALSCVEFLAKIHDPRFTTMTLLHNVPNAATTTPPQQQQPHQQQAPRQPDPCPLTCHILDQLLRHNPFRRHRFQHWLFTAEQTRVLVTSGIKTKIKFLNCSFSDQGAAFLEASVAREKPNVGLAELAISTSLPCSPEILIQLLEHDFVSVLEFLNITLSSVELCHALARAQLQHLDLRSACVLGDGGAALIDAIQQGHGPKELSLSEAVFVASTDSDDGVPKLIPFLQAISTNTYLKRLDLWDLKNVDVHHAMVEALRQNQGLTEFGLHNVAIKEDCWIDFLVALRQHPSLRKVTIARVAFSTSEDGSGHASMEDDDSDATPEDAVVADGRGKERSETVAAMLNMNRTIDEMTFHDVTFDRPTWDTVVVPLLECNLYRKRFVALQQIGVQSIRAAITAKVLTAICGNPTLTQMLLLQSLDLVCKSRFKRRFNPSS